MKSTLFGAIGMIALSTAASAHVTLVQREVPAGDTASITLRVPHGCDGLATTALRLSLPEGFYAARPMPKAGWKLDTGTGSYETPFINHGSEMTEGLRTVTWSGGNLEDGWYDEFTVRGTIGPELAPGTVLYFPVVQLCDGGETDWTDTSGAEGVATPAPRLVVARARAGASHDHSGQGAKAAGPIGVAGGFARATPPGARVGGGYLSVTNSGSEADRLVSASSDAAGRVEVHEMSMNGDVMVMRKLEDGLEIPAGETVVLSPGGRHLMFMQLVRPFVEGETVDVRLTFEKAGEMSVPLAVGPLNASGPGHELAKDHGHGAHQ
ncbi:copper chaperone PCu(A)C [Oceanicella sp. SM1341]|uniref:copper chaperone PCu(A)C n=1 Tax=Oceanicella sp. SM1341 TaxID=1548889 RepID=UPI001E613C5D|nr:copper chaperone PCu(A)C [Oceanicella sp. SM1341]